MSTPELPSTETPDVPNNAEWHRLIDPDDIDVVATDDRFDRLSGPVTRWGARGNARSIYVRDPDGNTVEFRSYA